MYIQNGVPVIILMTMNSRFRRISISVIVFFLLLGAGAAGCFAVGMSLYRSGRENIMNDNSVVLLRERSDSVVNRMKLSGFVDSPNESSIISELNNLALMYKGRALVCDSELRIVYDTAGKETGKYYLTVESVSALQDKSVSEVSDESSSVFTFPVSSLETNYGPDDVSQAGVFVFFMPLEKQMEKISALRSRILSTCVLFLVILTGFSIVACTRLAKPMKQLATNMRNLSDSYYRNEAIDVRVGYNEIGEIVDSANLMIRRLNEVDASSQEFVSNVSHELKTPMSSIKVLADSLLTQKDLPEEVYRDFLTDINSEIDRENLIITDLLTLVRMNGTAENLNIERVHVNKLLEFVLNRVLPLAKENDIEIVFENYRDVYAEIDENRMIICLTNLIENAIKYNRPKGHVKVSLNKDITQFYITIEDTGIGIPEEAIPHLFERFYRVDKARSRSTGGSGLGLSIAYEILKAHRGTIKVTSKLNEGSRFMVSLPLSYAFKEQKGLVES